MHNDEQRELAASYALEALSESEREAFERHLEDCPECVGEVASLRAAASQLAYAAPARRAPAALRARVLAAIEREPAGGVAVSRPAVAASPRSATNPWWLAAAAVLGAILVGGYALALRAHIGFLDQQLSESRAQAAVAQRQLVDAQARLASAQIQVQRVNLTTTILGSPDVVRIDLKGEPAAPAAVGRAFWSRTRGTLFTANALPALPGTQVYQLWIVTAAGPVSVGLLDPDANGRALVASGAATTSPPAAFAVTVEPAGGVPAPTGARVLIGAL